MVKHYRYYERVQPHRTYDERERAFIARGDVNKAPRGNLAKTTIERDFWWCRGNESGLAIVEDVMINQKLTPGVVNVLIYYVMLRSDMKLAKTYVEKIAGHWARKRSVQ